jgi:hypothetical protein
MKLIHVLISLALSTAALAVSIVPTRGENSTHSLIPHTSPQILTPLIAVLVPKDFGSITYFQLSTNIDLGQGFCGFHIKTN